MCTQLITHTPEIAHGEETGNLVRAAVNGLVNGSPHSVAKTGGALALEFFGDNDPGSLPHFFPQKFRNAFVQVTVHTVPPRCIAPGS
jgi:hypothetical protein